MLGWIVLVAVIYRVCIAAMVQDLATKKGLLGGMVWLGFLFGIVGLIYVGFLPIKRQTKD